MPPGTHLLISWSVANAVPLSTRDRRLVTLAGIAPDLDGLGYAVDLFYPSLDLFGRYHHVVGHNLGFCVLVVIAVALLAERRARAAAAGTLTFHIHLACDIISGRGPDDYQWPVPYFSPFNPEWAWTWSGQWYLHGWQNSVVYAVFVAVAVAIALRARRTPVEVLSARWDAAVFAAFAGVFGRRAEDGDGGGSGADPAPPPGG